MNEDVILAFTMPLMVIVVAVGYPLVRALAKRWERQDALRTSAGDPERLARIEQAIDAMAVEVERISEGQRYVTRLLSEREAHAALPRSREHGT
ncbi:MAG: hypothetical protein U0132_06435 [Gemmatimonadaceae bacterium]